ncbi:MAG: FHA domain-containing protein [Prevotellaceae bacterium]|nr:FHA domain-containing protein [Candidatus Minthosoma caballi]
MAEIIKLGRDGNQPFEIKASGVSSQHAIIEIDDYGNWWLEDCNSSNGTFVRDKEGNFVRWGRERITPHTFICLGPDNSKGCSFFAHQVVDYGNFVEDFRILQDKEEEFDGKVDELNKKIKKIRIAGPIIVLVVVFGITGIPFINELLGDYAMQIRIAVSSLSGILTALYDGSAKTKQLKAEREKWHHCPNPLCSNKLKSSDIENMQCPKCHKP